MYIFIKLATIRENSWIISVLLSLNGLNDQYHRDVKGQGTAGAG